MGNREATAAPLIALPLMMVATSATAQKFGLKSVSIESLAGQRQAETAADASPAPTGPPSIPPGADDR